MPLPLYGSGGRTLRTSAAIWPTCCLSIPLTIDLGRRRHLERDPLRRLQHDRVREADVQLEVGAAQRGAVADALDLEALREAVRDALDHVRDQRAREPVQRAIVAALGRPRDGDRPVLLLDLHPPGNLLAELAERPVDHHAARRERDRDAARNFDGLSADSTHALPDEADHLAADTLLCGRAAGDQAVGGGQDGDAHAAEDTREAVLASIDAAAGLRDALQVGDDALAVAAELELDGQRVEGGSSPGSLDVRKSRM